MTLKSLCEALNVSYKHQFQRVKDDPILGPASRNHGMQVPGDNQVREYICLPEEYVYGYVFSIRSDSPELIEYKRECYHVLYNHFHGTITRRAELYKELAASKKKVVTLESKLKSNPDYLEFENEKMRAVRLWKNIKDTSDEDKELFLDEEFE
ncbi:MAG: phage antirepressor N-terminal domain-containing protein [Paludibacter sp.]|nr:phage antirepressor N-terminal domain-containing protein [Paludibacter sp.]